MRVASNTAISLDGRINTRERRFTFFGSARDHARMSRLRSEADAVLVGGATFRNWPHPSLPDEGDRGRLRSRPWNVVVTRSLDVPLTAEFLGEPGIRPLFLTRTGSVPADFTAEVAAWDGDGDLPVAWILDQLARRGVERLLVEAGGDLLFQFIAADAIDQMHVTLCPLVVGGPAPSLADGQGFDRERLRELGLVSAEVEGDEIFLHYRNRRPARP
jgi:5-amino-6-(5-phosphoribosylamino)uracil reductase